MAMRASTRARAPETSATTSPSAKNSVRIWRRLAPSALRSASSRRRPSARTRKTFATFTQAMRSTKPTAPDSIQSELSILPTITSRRGATRGMNSERARTEAEGSSGNSATRFSVMLRMSFRADSRVAPSLSRARDRKLN